MKDRPKKEADQTKNPQRGGQPQREQDKQRPGREPGREPGRREGQGTPWQGEPSENVERRRGEGRGLDEPEKRNR